MRSSSPGIGKPRSFSLYVREAHWKKLTVDVGKYCNLDRDKDADADDGDDDRADIRVF